MVKQIHRHWSNRMYRRTYFSAYYRLTLPVGHHQHLRHKLLQNNRPQPHTLVKRRRLPHHDVLHGPPNETGNLPCRNHPSSLHDSHLPNFTLIVSLCLIVHDLDVGVYFLLWNPLRTAGRIRLHDPHHRGQ